VAPAGAPIRAADLARWAGLALSAADAPEMLRRAICERFGVRHSILSSTGRAGLTLLLRALGRLAPRDRDEVIVPSYTCFSVAASVVKAGLHPRIVDVDPATLDYDKHALAAADFSRVLAIIATNLYGLPNDLPALSALARLHRIFLIDDAAQAMGAVVGGRPSGSWGDAGLFSLDKGKNVCAVDGGIVVTSSQEIASALDEEIRHLPSPGAQQAAADVMKALAYSLMLRPSLYWIPNRVPQLGLGKTVFTTDFRLQQPVRALSGLALVMIQHLDEFTAARTRNASSLLERLRQIRGVQTIVPLPAAVPVYLRLPILVRDGDTRRGVIAALRAAGIGASGSYPSSLAEVPELRRGTASIGPVPGGHSVADRIVTLPTHAFVSPADIERTIDVLNATLRHGLPRTRSICRRSAGAPSAPVVPHS
jgi:perosamine synthetase